MIFTYIPNRNLTLITSENKVLTITSDNPNWTEILAALKRDDEASIIRLMSIPKTIEAFGTKVPERGEIEVRGSEVFYRTEKLYGEDVSRILTFVTDGIPHTGMIKFLERKLKNPSKNSVDSLYNFLENRGMPLTPEGKFRGYKGLNADYSSKNTGAEPLISGIRLANGSIDNHIGQSPRMERRFVCDDFNQGCGPGLHVGSLEYAIGWAGSEGRVVIVEVDPADVVSVPNAEHTKLRACAYTVVSDCTEKLHNVYTSECLPTQINSDNGDDGESCPDCGEDWNACTCDECNECGNENCTCYDDCDVCNEMNCDCTCSNGNPVPKTEPGQFGGCTTIVSATSGALNPVVNTDEGCCGGLKTSCHCETPAEVPPVIKDVIFDESSDTKIGWWQGFDDGRRHLKRMYYEEHRDNSTLPFHSVTFINAYLDGYKIGRGNVKPV